MPHLILQSGRSLLWGLMTLKVGCPCYVPRKDFFGRMRNDPTILLASGLQVYLLCLEKCKKMQGLAFALAPRFEKRKIRDLYLNNRVVFNCVSILTSVSISVGAVDGSKVGT